jgi:polyisoprenoid-binding protein YceI
MKLKTLQPLWVLLLILGMVGCADATSQPPTSTPLPESTPVAVQSDNEAETADADEDATEAETESMPSLSTFVIVPEESRASYLVSEEFFEGALAKLGIQAGNVEVVGSTQTIEGQLQLDFADLSTLPGTNGFTVDMTSLTTDQSRRDNWVRENGPSFNRYPVAEFVATGLADTPLSYTQGEEVQFKMVGDLTVREITQPVTFDVIATFDGDTATGVATADLRMTDFDIEPPNFANTLTVADEFSVEVEFTARQQ